MKVFTGCRSHPISLPSSYWCEKWV